MRKVSVQFGVAVSLVLAGTVLLGATSSYAQNENIKTRTIIEQLDDPADHSYAESASPPAAKRTKARYDYSVDSEDLPALPGVVSVEAPGEAGWVTVVEARAINASAAPPSGVNGVTTWLSAFLVIAGMVALLWARLPRLATLGRSLRAAEMFQMNWLTQAGPLAIRLGGRLGQTLSRRAAASETRKPDADTEAVESGEAIQNGLQQLNGLFCLVEQVVFELQNGSPLRDALQQELRLIAHRIDVTKAAAMSGEETLERLQGRTRVLSRELDRVRRIADSAAASVRDPRDRLAIPQTQSEAYALLGVNPDATPLVLKKLVDALRMTWHPDHARNESDRLLREERIKQINIAWDLITTEPER